MPGGAQRVAPFRGAAVLPDDRAGAGRAGAPVPDDDRLALVGDADRGDRLAGGVQLADDLGQRLAGDAPDVVGVVLDPARLREVLRELAVRTRPRHAVVVDREGAHAGGARVDRDDAAHSGRGSVRGAQRRRVGEGVRCARPAFELDPQPARARRRSRNRQAPPAGHARLLDDASSIEARRSTRAGAGAG